jgi:cytochrome bd-type quinol oxidase subunit 2
MNNNNSNNKKCDSSPEVLNREDPAIMFLEDNVKGFKIGLMLLSVVIIAIILLYIFNPVVLEDDPSTQGIKSKIGYIIVTTIVFFTCLTLLGKMFIKVKTGDNNSNSDSNNKTYSLANIILTIASFIIILIIAFSDDFKKNKALLMNYTIIFVLLLVSCVAYLFSTKNDYASFSKLPKAIQMFYGDRAKYTIILIAYLFLLALLYYYDPWNIMTKYVGLTIFISSIVAITLFVMIYLYQYYFTHPSQSNTYSQSPTFMSFMKSFYILGALGISGFLLYSLLSLLGTFNQDSYNKSELGHTLLNYIMLAGMLAVIWKLANSGGYLFKNPVFRLIFNTILYIPCLLVNVFDYFTSQYNTGKKEELTMLFLALALFVGYFLMKFLIFPFIAKKYYGQNGISVVNDPMSIEKETIVASYQTLNNGAYVDQGNINMSGEDDGSGIESNSATHFFKSLLNSESTTPSSETEPKRNYHYAVSFWFYLDSFPPNTSSAYNKTSNILSFGGNPAIRYNAVTNSLVITMKYDDNCKIMRRKNVNIKTKSKSKSNDQNINITEGFNQMQSEIKNKIEEVKTMPMEVELDEIGNMIVYVKPGVLLQKWNNVVINYNGGTLDIFYNGELVKSAIEMVPCIMYDSLKVGDENGISGNVANVLYFNESLDYLTVHTLYSSLNGVNPPVIPKPGPSVIQELVTYVK